MDQKNRLFLSEARQAHDRLTNLIILTNPLLCGVWHFRKLAGDFAHLTDPQAVKDAVLKHISFPTTETAIRRMDLRESVLNINWTRQKDSLAEMMIFVACAVYENFLEALESKLASLSGTTSLSLDVSKGFQFANLAFNLTTVPATSRNSTHRKKLSNAMSHLSHSQFMTDHICPTVPDRGGRNILDDFEMKLQTFLVFKKLRNGIIHGAFDRTIPHHHTVVDRLVSKEAQGLKAKANIAHTPPNEFFVTHYDAIGFIGLVLRLIDEIDFLFQLSPHGESELITRLRALPESRRTGSPERRKDLARLALCLQRIGVPAFKADESARAHFVDHFAWRG